MRLRGSRWFLDLIAEPMSCRSVQNQHVPSHTFGIPPCLSQCHYPDTPAREIRSRKWDAVKWSHVCWTYITLQIFSRRMKQITADLWPSSSFHITSCSIPFNWARSPPKQHSCSRSKVWIELLQSYFWRSSIWHEVQCVGLRAARYRRY